MQAMAETPALRGTLNDVLLYEALIHRCTFVYVVALAYIYRFALVTYSDVVIEFVKRSLGWKFRTSG